MLWVVFVLLPTCVCEPEKLHEKDLVVVVNIGPCVPRGRFHRVLEIGIAAVLGNIDFLFTLY